MWKVLLLASCIVAGIVLGSCCANEVHSESVSPDGRYIASVIERNCGATTDYVTAVQIRGARSAFSGRTWDDVFRVGGVATVRLSWDGSNHLLVARPHRPSQTFAASSTWDDIRITYIDLPPDTR